MMLLIGACEDEKEIVEGLRILDTDTMEYKDIPVKSVYEAVVDGDMEIKNLGKDDIYSIINDDYDTLKDYPKIIDGNTIQSKVMIPLGVDAGWRSILIDVNGIVYSMNDE